MKNIILVTGGAGFVGSNLIELLLQKTKKKIISLDNYSTGKKKIISKIIALSILIVTLKILILDYANIEKKFIQFFILVNLLESIKVLKILMNVMTLIQ